jgi:hypothetical protein
MEKFLANFHVDMLPAATRTVLALATLGDATQIASFLSFNTTQDDCQGKYSI